MKKMQKALQSYFIFGLMNNLNFLARIFKIQEFQNFEYDTSFIARYLPGLIKKKQDYSNIDIAYALSYYYDNLLSQSNLPDELQCFRVNHELKKEYKIKV